ncbi:hypothetical protein [Microbacterium dextranolyticum]|uniref:Membrane protein n=1 Tax=Microbacterium dextranolyticum TaxID=36806 RepID=A0A9W6M5R8_9MICO|nr:hypothetical protein [Microbacterium dextranolyticum]MBM7464007.1 hypothetical protein [Microbacterium dextranolyticum]GLJ95087.1 membrane protein [Microbacterium dextranolyticum]
MSASIAARTPAPHTPLGRVTAVAVALAAVVCIVVLAFAWPSATAAPRDLPVAVVGADSAAASLETALAEKQPGVFDLQRVDDRGAAVTAIERREVYGAILAGATPEVLTASAANITANQMLMSLAGALETQTNQAAAAAASAAGAPAPAHIAVTVTDVVPLASSDPRGTGLAAAMFPLVMGGMIGGIVISMLIVGAMRRVVAVLIYSALGGVALTGILAGWFGALQGDFWVEAAVIALALAAIAAPITGAVALIGRPGIAVGPVVMLLFANPISSATMPREFLPGAWGAVGQLFPPGAAATLLRDASYFPQADASLGWLVLTAWTVGGLLLSVLGHFRAASVTHAATDLAAVPPSRDAEPVPA